jgi:predicted DsbA family dithiol-disulfide isomerase
MQNPVINIEIWSDIVCPFCYVGKKKIQQVIEKLNIEDEVQIIWRSYQLDPDLPSEKAYPSLEYLMKKKNISAEQMQGMNEYLKQQGLQYGIDFQLDKSMVFNTFNAHRLLQWAKEFNKSSELKEAFMKAYFTDGIDLSNPENLISAVGKVGLDTQKAIEVLNSNDYSEAVENDIYQSKTISLRGVPHFLFNDKFFISGAQEDLVFENAIKGELLRQKQALS